MKSQIPILIVLYNPNEMSLNQLYTIQSNFILCVFDNSNTRIDLDSKPLNCFYEGNGINQGISNALIWMSKLCMQLGYEKFIFFDQDTQFNLTAIEIMTQKVENNKNYIVHFTSEKKYQKKPKFVINSCTVFNVKTIIENKDALNKYFVDAIDLMLSFQTRIKNQGIETIYIENLDHRSGQGYEKWNIYGFTVYIKEYSKNRRKEFIQGHLKLLIEIISKRKIIDFFMVIKFIIAFYIGQIKVDLTKKFGSQL
jgi:hypothetical protein